ncbi:MAG: redoxin family protein [Chthoniobacteraceae bacterium]
MFRRLLLPLIAWVAFAAPHPELGANFSAPTDVGRDLLGSRPTEWTFTDWQGSPPLTLAGLRGKAVLIRWWTSPGCPYCSASADSLNAFAKKYRDRGLVVIGAYHHKAQTPLTTEHVTAQATRLGFNFPTAIDHDWRTLNAWWLDKTDRGWTSVTFLIGRDGTIRHIHGGGAFFDGEPGHAALEKAIVAALDARKP